jgi:DNA-binding NarL/FixJ family response regulator
MEIWHALFRVLRELWGDHRPIREIRPEDCERVRDLQLLAGECREALPQVDPGRGGRGCAAQQAGAYGADGALGPAREEKLDLALLDVNIAGEPVTAVAEALAERALPFVFCTGYQAENLPSRYPAAPTLTKPFQIADLRSALQRALASGSGPS